MEISVAAIDSKVVDKRLISEAVRALGVIGCDICKSGSASYDVFIKSALGVPFLKRCCQQCANDFG